MNGAVPGKLPSFFYSVSKYLLSNFCMQAWDTMEGKTMLLIAFTDLLLWNRMRN